jgi:hypothetical protein
MVGSMAGSGARPRAAVSAARRAWLLWRELRLASWATLMAADPASMAAWSCLVVAGGSSAPLPPGGSRSVLGKAADVSSVGLWSLAASSSSDEVDRWTAAWGLANLPNKGG